MPKAVMAMFLNQLQAMDVGMERTKAGATNQLVDLVTLVTGLVHILSKLTILGWAHVKIMLSSRHASAKASMFWSGSLSDVVRDFLLYFRVSLLTEAIYCCNSMTYDFFFICCYFSYLCPIFHLPSEALFWLC